MGNGIIGKILYYWIFIIGALFFAKLFNVFTSNKSIIIFLIAATIIYVVWQLMRYLGQKNRAEKEYAARAEANKVHKGQTHKKKKK